MKMTNFWIIQDLMNWQLACLYPNNLDQAYGEFILVKSATEKTRGREGRKLPPRSFLLRCSELYRLRIYSLD